MFHAPSGPRRNATDDNNEYGDVVCVRVAGVMGLDNFDFASAAYNHWLRSRQGALSATRMPEATIDSSTGRVLVLDSDSNRELLQRLLKAG